MYLSKKIISTGKRERKAKVYFLNKKPPARCRQLKNMKNFKRLKHVIYYTFLLADNKCNLHGYHPNSALESSYDERNCPFL